MTKRTYRSFSAGELSEDMYGRYDVDKYGSGCMIMKNWIIMAEGGVYKRPGMRYRGNCGVETSAVRLIPFIFSVVQPYVLEFGDYYMRVYKDGELVLEDAQTITAATQADPCQLTIAGHGYTTGDEVFLSGISGMTELNNRQLKITVVDKDNFTLDGIDSTDYTAFTSGGTASKVYEVTTSYAADDLSELYYAQTADVMTLCHRDYPPAGLTRTGHTAWTFSEITFLPDIDAPTGASATNSTGSGSTTYSYKITAVAEENYEESLATSAVSCTNDLTTSGNENTISWAAVTGAIKYNVYLSDNGIYGYIGSTENTSFVDDYITPDTTDTPPTAENPFDAEDDYPGVVGFAHQRRVFASTNNKPDTVWMSRTGMYGNFSKSTPNKDDDSFSFAVASGQVNSIKHLIGFSDLLAVTGFDEWRLYGTDGTITPTTIAAKPESNYGADIVMPVKVGKTVLFATRFGRHVRDYAYDWYSDGYNGNDITILSSHLLKDTYIKDWAFAQEPDGIIWVVMADGSLCSITYQKEHKVWGWARHETNGYVESVTVIPDDDERRDVPYFVVRRTINGETRRYVETIEEYIDEPMSDAFFVDAGASYSGTATDTITGLWHLEGETVKVYADGNVLADKTVENGSITVTSEYETFAIGLEYDYELQPMATESDQSKYGASKGDPKEIKTIDIEVVRTRGLFFGQNPEALDNDQLNEMPPKFEDDDLSSAIVGYTGIYEMAVDTEWDGQYVAPYIYSNYPVPAKILTMTPNYAID